LWSDDKFEFNDRSQFIILYAMYSLRKNLQYWDFVAIFADYEFNISDFNEPGKAFGEEELQNAIQRGAIQILDDATIADMKAKRARDKARDEAAREQQAIEAGEMTDWKAVAKEWEEWENSQNNGN